MGILELQFCATLENLTSLQLPPSDDWHFRLKCTNCQEEHPNLIYFNLIEIKDLEDSKAKANYYAKCSFCKRELTVLYVDSSLKEYVKSE